MKLINKTMTPAGEIYFYTDSAPESGDMFYARTGRFFADKRIHKDLGEAMTNTPDNIWVLACLKTDKLPVSADVIGLACVNLTRLEDKQTVSMDWAWIEPEYRHLNIYRSLIKLRLKMIKEDTWADTVKVIAMPANKEIFSKEGFSLDSQRGKYSYMSLAIKRKAT